MMHKLLVIEDDVTIQHLVQAMLEMHGYEVVLAGTGQEGLRLAHENPPDLILLDINLPDVDGFEIGRRLRQSTRLALVPIIVLTAKAATEDKLNGFAAGADDYVTKPFDMDELLARVRVQLRRLEQGLLSELTGLPGNQQIERAIKQVVRMADRTWAVLYADMDEFKAYNDAYGFLAGNELIKSLGRILSDVVQSLGRSPDLDFVGHIGGDDFVVITAAGEVEKVCREIIRRFDVEVPRHYTAEDRERGYLVSSDRQGNRQRFPFVSLSIAAVTNRHRPIWSHLEVATVAAEVKKKAKSRPGSSYFVDRRSGKAGRRSARAALAPPKPVDTGKHVEYNQRAPVPPTAE